jgi:Domain of unknown function (DUF1707)
MSVIPGREAADDPQHTPGMRPMRASDQDRTEAVLALTDHVTDGRLDSDEFEARVSAAYAATYLHELDPLFVDLPYAAPRPVVPTGTTGRDVARRDRFAGRRPVFALLLVLAILASIAVATGHLWLLIPVAWFAVVGTSARRHHRGLPQGAPRQLHHRRR